MTVHAGISIIILLNVVASTLVGGPDRDSARRRGSLGKRQILVSRVVGPPLLSSDSVLVKMQEATTADGTRAI